MAEIIQKAQKLQYKIVEIPKLTRGIAKDSTELIGNTPLVRLNWVSQEAKAEVVAKLESFSPLGSLKERIGLSMIVDAEEKRLINKDTMIVEPTSDNTGITLAFVCGARRKRMNPYTHSRGVEGGSKSPPRSPTTSLMRVRMANFPVIGGNEDCLTWLDSS
jgi:hypothetical protein